jgi:hypothetical protein
MNQNQNVSADEDMLEEYDFSKGLRGKYVGRFKEGCNVVLLEPDVAEIFTDAESVNNALRNIAHIIRNQIQRNNRSVQQTGLDERRRIMAQQAEQMKTHYQESTGERQLSADRKVRR